MSKVVVKVSRLASYLKNKLENDLNLQNIVVQGEISNFTNHKSGHWYFSLKDDSAVIKCIMFHTYASNAKFLPKDGDLVLVRARVTMFEPSGQLQLNVNAIKMDGVGDLYKQYELLKHKLAQQGLFDSQHKQVIPAYPMNIAIITGDKTAALRDCLTTIHKRWPVARVSLHHCLVQGNQASQQIIDTLIKVDSLNYDVILLVRGGGSIEDLWAFNDERLAHIIYDLKTPIVTGVGHETDTTIVDFVSDLRAPTPTGAALLATPNLTDVLLQLRQCQIRIENAAQKQIETAIMRIDFLNNKLESVMADKLNYQAMLLQKYKNTIQLKLTSVVHMKYNALISYRYSLFNNISKIIKEQHFVLLKYNQLITNLVSRKRDLTVNSYLNQVKLLDAYSPLKVMQRGYSVAYCQDKVINSISNINVDDDIKIRLSDGELYTKVRMVNKDE